MKELHQHRDMRGNVFGHPHPITAEHGKLSTIIAHGNSIIGALKADPKNFLARNVNWARYTQMCRRRYK